jgi:hypothetical protein
MRLQSGAVFFMTSGLRSLRDKVATYFEEALESGPPLDKLYKAVNLFADLVRRVAKEDKEYLDASGLQFNIHAIMGGQFSADATHKLFLIYPQGNWVEITSGTPYHIIGETGYGKPVLDRTLKHADSIHFALKVGCLAFDSTRISAADVDFPLDVVVYSKGPFPSSNTASSKMIWRTSPPGGRNGCARASTPCLRNGSTPSRPASPPAAANCTPKPRTERCASGWSTKPAIASAGPSSWSRT